MLGLIPSPFRVLEEGDNYLSIRRALDLYEEALIDKWRWLLEGTAHPDSKETALPKIDQRLWKPLAYLFENQQYQTQILQEDTLKTDVTLPITYSLPLIRKVFPSLIATRICAIQPMPAFSGGTVKCFFQDFERVDTEESTTTPDSDYAYATEGSVPKTVKMTITSTQVTAGKDILAATWSSEVAEDARGTLGIDVEAEHLNEMGNEIVREMDTRILAEIMSGASAGNVNWSATVPSGYISEEWYRTLGHAFIQAKNLVEAARFRQCDYIVAGPTLAEYFELMKNFTTTDETPAQPGIRLSTVRIGTINKSVDVYKSFALTGANALKGIVGYYPPSQIDAGYIYLPYIPLAPMPLVYAGMNASTGAYENKDKWTRNVRTRWGKYLVNGQCFSTMTKTS